jgi:hypothetical protein
MRAGEETVALAVAYLMRPSLFQDHLRESHLKLKSVACKIYNLYALHKASKN